MTPTREEYLKMWDPHGTRRDIPGYYDRVDELFDTLEAAGPNPYGSNHALENYGRRGQFPEFDEKIMRAGRLAMELTDLVRRNERMM